MMSKGAGGVQKNLNSTCIPLPQPGTFLIMRRTLVLYAIKSLVSSIAVQYYKMIYMIAAQQRSSTRRSWPERELQGAVSSVNPVSWLHIV